MRALYFYKTITVRDTDLITNYFSTPLSDWKPIRKLKSGLIFMKLPQTDHRKCYNKNNFLKCSGPVLVLMEDGNGGYKSIPEDITPNNFLTWKNK